MAMEKLITAGIILVILGMVAIIAGAAFSAYSGGTSGGKAEAKVAVGGFIGPIPFGFGNDRQMLYAVMGLSIAVFVLFYILQFSMARK
jgi:uncharacterized protein (TIGR00304 family)